MEIFSIKLKVCDPYLDFKFFIWQWSGKYFFVFSEYLENLNLNQGAVIEWEAQKDTVT